MVWWIRWNWESRWWAVVPQFHCLNLLHNCRRESLSEIDAREVCYGFDRLWLAVFYSCPPRRGWGLLVRRSRGGWLHPWEWFRLLLRGRIKENLLIETLETEPVQGSNSWDQPGRLFEKIDFHLVADHLQNCQMRGRLIQLQTFDKLLWNQMDSRRTKTLKLIRTKRMVSCFAAELVI